MRSQRRGSPCRALPSLTGFRREGLAHSSRGLPLQETGTALPRASGHALVAVLGMSAGGQLRCQHAGVPASETRVSPGGQAHLLNEVLSVSADVVHTVLVDGEVCLEGFVFLQQALQGRRRGGLSARQAPRCRVGTEGHGPARAPVSLGMRRHTGTGPTAGSEGGKPGAQPERLVGRWPRERRRGRPFCGVGGGPPGSRRARRLSPQRGPEWTGRGRRGR